MKGGQRKAGCGGVVRWDGWRWWVDPADGLRAEGVGWEVAGAGRTQSRPIAPPYMSLGAKRRNLPSWELRLPPPPARGRLAPLVAMT